MRNEKAWKKNKHAYARPRFLDTVVLKGPPRPKLTPPGSGAHVGCMNLDQSVTAFCFSASSSSETALDVNIKGHQQGALSFCLQKALAALQNRCTYEQLLKKACSFADDIRAVYMPEMDQYIRLSFSPNSPPSEAVFLDERYATCAEHVLRQRRVQAERVQGTERVKSCEVFDNPESMIDRDASCDFVPSPFYGISSIQGEVSGHPSESGDCRRNGDLPSSSPNPSLERNIFGVPNLLGDLFGGNLRNTSNPMGIGNFLSHFPRMEMPEPAGMAAPSTNLSLSKPLGIMRASSQPPPLRQPLVMNLGTSSDAGSLTPVNMTTPPPVNLVARQPVVYSSVNFTGAVVPPYGSTYAGVGSTQTLCPQVLYGPYV